mgnify:CR=1 FL=1
MRIGLAMAAWILVAWQAPALASDMEVSATETIRDMSPVLGKAKAANPDVLLIHLHSGPTALLIRQAVVPSTAGSHGA